ncbi:thiolase, N-terminal domain protein [Burkholderia thailandensis E444]|nr:thiolase, N-terminal domain protein [Burkholderia thailandensis E444]
MTEAFLCDAIRTPIGRYGGALAPVRADDLGAVPLKALAERNRDVDWAAVDDVIYGCANQAGEDNRNVARMSLLLAGLPHAVPGATINRLCGSGMDAIASPRRARDQGRRGEPDDRGRRREHEPCAVRHGQGDERVLAAGRDLRYDDRLALRQSADETAVWRRFDAGDGRARRDRLPREPRRSGRVRAAQPAEGGARAGRRHPRAGNRAGDDRAEEGRAARRGRATSIRARRRSMRSPNSRASCGRTAR